MADRLIEPAVAPVPPAPEPVPLRPARAPWYLWVPALLILIPALVPLMWLLGRLTGAGADAWRAVANARVVELLLQTVGLTAAVTATALTVGVATAWLTTRTDLPGRRMWWALAALPLVIPSYVGALVLISAFGPRGLLGGMLGTSTSPSGFFGAWATLSLFTFPYVHLTVSAALRNLDPALEEAARGLGASPWRSFRTVTLGQLRPALAAGGLLVALYTLSDFGAVSLMRFDAFTRAIYLQYAGRLDRTPAAALAIVLILVVLAVLWVEQRSRGRGSYFVRRPKRPARRVSLPPRGRVAALAFLGALAALSVVVPVAVLGSWLVRGVARGETFSPVLPAAAGSITVSALAAVLAMAVAVPVAALVVRHRSRATMALDRTFYVVYALPHITVALAIVFFAANAAPAVYQSIGLLVVAYVALFLPLASGSAQTSLRQVDPHIEEAARGLGRSRLGTLFTVTVPLTSRGLLAGGALVFLTVMKELPATLLLRPTGFDTLAVRIWSAASEGFFARASAAALVLLLISAAPMYLLSAHDR